MLRRLSIPQTGNVVFALAISIAGSAFADSPPLTGNPTTVRGQLGGLNLFKDAASIADAGDRYIARFGVSRDSGDNIGIDDGFTTVEWLMPMSDWDDNSLLFGDFRALIRDDLTAGANVGFGYRTYDEDLNRIWGFLIHWDRRRTDRNHFNQLGLGLESLGEVIDFRLNGYIPNIGDERNPLPNAFRGMSLLIGRAEVAMAGGDVELGVALPELGGVQTRVFGGYYHFAADDVQDANGWRARAEARIRDAFWVDVSAQDDEVFGRTLMVGGAIRWLHIFRSPHPPARRAMGHKFVRMDDTGDSIIHRLGDPVERLQNIVLTLDETVATNAAGTAPFTFLHVVSGAAPGGDGSIEMPYDTFADALADAKATDPNNVIYTPQGGTFPEDVTLVTDSTVFSNAPIQTVTTQFGDHILPFSGASPDLSAAADIDNLILEDGATLSGFDINGTVTGASVTGATLEKSLVRPPAAGDAITVTGPSSVTFSSVAVTSMGGKGVVLTDTDATLTGVSVTGATDDGIEINAAGTDRTVALSGITVDSAGMEGIDANVTGAGDLVLTVSGTNTLSAVGSAFDAATGGGSTGDLTLNLSGLTLTTTGAADAALNIDGTAGAGTVFISQFDAISVPSVPAVGAVGGILIDTATFDSDLTNGMIDQVVSSAVTIGASGSTTDVMGDGLELLNTVGDLNITALNIFNDSGTGLLVDTGAAGTGMILTTGTGSNISTSTGPAIDLTVPGANPLTIDLSFNAVQSTDSPADGISLDGVDGALTITTTTVNNAAIPPSRSIEISNTPTGLTANFGTTSIMSLTDDTIPTNVDTTMGNTGLILLFNSITVTGP